MKNPPMYVWTQLSDVCRCLPVPGGRYYQVIDARGIWSLPHFVSDVNIINTSQEGY
jgi:hypothetical protein